VRQAFAGIRGKNFGTVTIGNQYTTEFGQGITVAGTVNSYGFGGSGLSVSTSGKQTNTAVHRLGEITQGNSIRWVAPAVSGITFAADLGKSTSEATGTTGGANTTDTTSDFLGLSANYKAGKLNATLAYSEIKEKSLLQATPSVTVVSATSQCVDTGMVYGAFSGDDQSGGTCTLTAPLRDRKQKNLTASATYDLTAAAKVYAYYADREMTGTTVLDYKTYNLGAQYTIGKVTPFAQMSDGKLKSSTGATTADLSSYQVGATYAFSKRTTGYAYVAEYKNKVATGTDAKKAEVTAFGISHNF
jgi:predicted porin